MASETVALLWEFLRPGRAERVIPPMDGPLRPNDDLDAFAARAVVVPVREPRACCLVGDDVIVSTLQGELLRVDVAAGRTTETGQTVCRAAPLITDEDGRVVTTTSAGVVALDLATGDAIRIAHGSGILGEHVTGIAIDRRFIYVAEGSAVNDATAWVRDLLECEASGRIWRIDRRSCDAEVIAEGLAYPVGLACVDGEALLVTEASGHRLSRLSSADGWRRHTVWANTPFYPWRLARVAGVMMMTAWSMRTELIEFTIAQREFVAAMIDQVEEQGWIQPALATTGQGHEYLQNGGIKALGRTKPWAPARSYGLCVRVDDEGRAVSSAHSRAGGVMHGILDLAEARGGTADRPEVALVCAGREAVVVGPLPKGDASAGERKGARRDGAG